MQINWKKAVKIVLDHEGGEVDDPNDPGGHTNLGVTQSTLNRARQSTNLDLPEGVDDLTTTQAKKIYEHLYWYAVKADELPAGIDIFAFDMAVNQGVDTAMRSLQKAAGTTVDGIWGPKTNGAIRKISTKTLLIDFAARRAHHYAKLSDDLVDRFGFGWYRRLISTFQFSLMELQ